MSGTLIGDLIASEVVSLDEAVSADIELLDVSRSHAAYRLSVNGELRAFVKQADPARSLGRTLAAEAAVYRMAGASPALAAVVPRCRLVAAHDSLIVLDVLPSPTQHPQWQFAGPVPEGPAGYPTLHAYGRAVARVHSVRPVPFGEAPWILLAPDAGWGHDPTLPPPVRRLFRTVAAEPVFRDGFRAASRHWQAAVLVHGDLRWSNVLVTDETEPRVWLLDWELACLGDPAWDVGSVFGDIVSTVTLSSGGSDIPRQASEAARPFLTGYREVAGMGRAAWAGFLGQSIRLAGVRLIQAISEYGHVGPSEMQAVEPLLLPWSADLLHGRGPLATHLVEVSSA